MWTLGTSWNCCLRYAITAVTRENGSSRDPYPPTTVSLLTNPRFDFRSARTTFISHLNPHSDPDRENSGGSGRQGGTARRLRGECACAGMPVERADESSERLQRRRRADVG